MSIFEIIIAIIVFCFFFHEAGHWLAAFILTHETIAFRRSGLRFIWDMPRSATPSQRKIIGASGFLCEGIMAAVALAIGGGYMPVLIVFTHMALYPVYCGAYNDFQWL
jgi:hypothetical protein